MMKLATVGTSWITAKFIEAVKQTDHFTFTAVYSRHADTAQLFAETHGAPLFFSDLEEMASSKDIDVVYIASPNSLHFEQTKLFLQHKKHVICEKPIFSNLKEWDEAVRLADENGVFLFEAIRNIHSPNFKIMKQHIGQIGPVRSTQLSFIQYSDRYDALLQGEESPIFSPLYSGGVLVDLGVYPIFLAAALFGEPNQVSYYPVVLRNGIDGSGTLILGYQDFICTILCSKIANSTMPSEFQGEAGTMVIDRTSIISRVEMIHRRTNDKQSVGVFQHENDMVYEIEAFARMIKTNNHVEYEESKRLSRIVLSITEKARRHGSIKFEADTDFN
jgi:predicted dehydrogenase